MQSKVAGLALLMAVAACGGGGGSSTPAVSDTSGNANGSAPPAPAPAPSPSPSPSPAPSPAPAPAPAAAAPVQVSTSAALSVYSAALANGGHVDVWTTSPSSAEAVVLAQIFDASGQKIGSPVTVFSGGSTNGWSAGGVVGLPDGSFLVTASGAINTADSLQSRLYVQKVSAAGQLVATGGVSDANINAGLADRLASDNEVTTLQYSGGPFFVNPDGSYVLYMRQTSRPTPVSTQSAFLLNVDAAGNVATNALDLQAGYSAGYPAPVVTRMGNGNFFIAGNSTITYGPIVWKIVTPDGTVVAQQNLGAAPGNGSSNPQVTTLADGSVLLSMFNTISTGINFSTLHIDASGKQVGTGPQLSNVTGNPNPLLTALPGGGYVFTWVQGSQLLGQYYSASDQPLGEPFVIATGVVASSSFAGFATGSPYSVAPSGSGFVAVYAATTSDGTQVFEMTK